MITYGDYFTGGGMATAGFKDAGFTPIFGVEYDPHPKRIKTSMLIADTYEANFGAHILRKPVQDISPADLPRVDWFHASPVCKNASVANADGGEDEVDIITAQATIDYFTHHLPKVVTIENVYTYRHFQAYKNIIQALWSCGYGFREDHINMADYGVPQTRKRLIVTAVLGEHMPSLLPPTHEPEPAGFFALRRWVSWYEAIEDLIPTLPDSQFAKWQLERMPEELKNSFIVNPNRTSFEWASENDIIDNNRPMPTCTSAEKITAFIMAQGKYGDVVPTAFENNPALTVTSNSNQSGIKAFVCDGQNAGRPMTIMDKDEAFCTLSAQNKGVYRAYTNGRIVKMTPHAVARFQSLPDWYKLSGKASVDFTLIGNGVPSLFCEKLGRFVAAKYLEQNSYVDKQNGSG